MRLARTLSFNGSASGSEASLEQFARTGPSKRVHMNACATHTERAAFRMRAQWS